MSSSHVGVMLSSKHIKFFLAIEILDYVQHDSIRCIGGSPNLHVQSSMRSQESCLEWSEGSRGGWQRISATQYDC